MPVAAIVPVTVLLVSAYIPATLEGPAQLL